MKRLHRIGLGLVLVTSWLGGCGGSGGGHPTWSKSFGGEGRDEVLGLAATADGVLLAGALGMDPYGVAGDNGDLWVASLDDAGNLLWQYAIGQRNVVAPGVVPPTLRAVAADAGGAWLAGHSAAGHAQVARLDLSGGTTWTTELAPHKPERFEVGWSVAPAGAGVTAGAVVAVWADDVVTESSSDGHPATPDVKQWEAPRWRVRVLRVDGDGGAGWARTLPPLYTEREPQALCVTGFPDGGAAVAVSLEDTLDVTRFGPDGAILWTLQRSGNDDARGLIALQGGDFVGFGDSIGLLGRRGFATRFTIAGAVAWHEHYGEVDRLTAGTLACPSTGACRLALAGQDYGAVVPALSDALLVGLDGALVTETENVAIGPAVAVGYEPATGQTTVTAFPWTSQLESQVLDSSFRRLGEPRRADQAGPGAAATGPDGRLLFVGHAPGRLVAYGAGVAPQLYAVDLVGPERRLEAGWSVLPMGAGALVTGAASDGRAWGVRIGDSGSVLWQQRWEMGASGPHQLAPTADGGFWLASGTTLGQYSAEGSPVALIGSRVPNPVLAAGSGGSLLAVGQSRAAAWNGRFELQFSKSYASGDDWLRLGAGVAMDEGWMVVGNAGGGDALLALRLDAAGSVVGSTRIRAGSYALRGLASVTAVGGRAVVATTVATDDAGEDIMLFGLDGAGGVAWSRRYGGLLDDRVSDIAAPPGGGLVLGGASSTANVDFDAWVLRLDAEGLVDSAGDCQALLDSPNLVVDQPAVTAGDFSVGTSDEWKPSRAPTGATPLSPALVVARQCVGQATSLSPDAGPDASPDSADAADADPEGDAGPDLPPTSGFGIQADLGGAIVAEGQAVPRYSTITLTPIVPGDPGDYTYAWFTGPAEDPSPAGTDPQLAWLMEGPERFRLVVRRDGAVVAEVERVVDVLVSQVTADLVVCPSFKPWAGAAIQLRARTILDTMTVALTDHPEVASLDWTLQPYFLTPAGIDPGPPMAHTSTDSIWHLNPNTLVAGAWYEVLVHAKDADGTELAVSNAARFEISALPQVSTCGPPP